MSVSHNDSTAQDVVLWTEESRWLSLMLRTTKNKERGVGVGVAALRDEHRLLEGVSNASIRSPPSAVIVQIRQHCLDQKISSHYYLSHNHLNSR